MVRPTLDALNVDLGRLAATFDSSVYGVDWPNPPVPTAAVVLTGVVVATELGVFASRYFGTDARSFRAIESSSVAMVVGAAALTTLV